MRSVNGGFEGKVALGIEDGSGGISGGFCGPVDCLLGELVQALGDLFLILVGSSCRAFGDLGEDRRGKIVS